MKIPDLHSGSVFQIFQYRRDAMYGCRQIAFGFPPPQAQDHVALLAQQPGAHDEAGTVTAGLTIFEQHHQACIMFDEIQSERAEWRLAAEAITFQRLQPRPKAHFDRVARAQRRFSLHQNLLDLSSLFPCRAFICRRKTSQTPKMSSMGNQLMSMASRSGIGVGAGAGPGALLPLVPWKKLKRSTRSSAMAIHSTRLRKRPTGLGTDPKAVVDCCPRQTVGRMPMLCNMKPMTAMPSPASRNTFDKCSSSAVSGPLP